MQIKAPFEKCGFQSTWLRCLFPQTSTDQPLPSWAPVTEWFHEFSRGPRPPVCQDIGACAARGLLGAGKAQIPDSGDVQC